MSAHQKFSEDSTELANALVDSFGAAMAAAESEDEREKVMQVMGLIGGYIFGVIGISTVPHMIEKYKELTITAFPEFLAVGIEAAQNAQQKSTEEEV